MTANGHFPTMENMGDVERTIERHSVLLREHDRRISALEVNQTRMTEGFALINQSLGELKAEIRELKAVERAMEAKRQRVDGITWAILFLILTQLVIAAFEFLKR